MEKILYNLATDRYRGILAGIIKFFLFFFSLVYGLVIRILIFLQRRKLYQLDCKVISVGNITLGGTGKTSLVEYIARYLKNHGLKVAILTRGYKKKITNYQLPITNYETMGDEPFMLRRNLVDIPIIVDANRIRAGKAAKEKYQAQAVVLDDGFQQWKIKKDLEIVTIDATYPFANCRMLPRGILREPLSSLRRADIFLLTKTNLQPDTRKTIANLKLINPRAEIFLTEHRPAGFYELSNPHSLFQPQVLAGKTSALFCGIADPASFENLVTALGIKIGLSFRFPDHYDYRQKDLDKIFQACRDQGIDRVITTEKDAARLSSLRLMPNLVNQGSDSSASRSCASEKRCIRDDFRLLILRIELQFTADEERFHRRLLGVFAA